MGSISNLDMRAEAGTIAAIRRRPKACDSCWQRKIRCNEEDGACQNCKRYGQKCTTTRSDGSLLVRGSGQPSAHQDGPRQKRRRTGVAFEPEPNSVPTTSIPRDHFARTSDQSTFRNLQNATHTANNPMTVAQNGAYLDSPAASRSLSTNDSINATGVEGVVLIEPIENPRKSKYAGKTSTQVLAKSAEDFSKQSGLYLGVMEFFCPLLNHAEEVSTPKRSNQPPLIDKSTALQCVNAFFDTVPRVLPFLVESHFRQLVDDFYRCGGLDDLLNVCCIYLVITVGARSLLDSENISTTHFAAAWAMYDVIIATPYLTSVQCLILMTIELTNQNKEGQAVFAIGTAIRIAQSLGFHRALSAHREVIELRFVERNYHLSSCVWWTCYCLDKKLSFEFGRISIINDADCDVDSVSVSTPGVARTGSSETSSELIVFPHLIQICRILSTIMARLFSRTADPNDEHGLLREISAVDEMLTDWKHNLPRAWAVDPELISTDMGPNAVDGLILQCLYYNALLVIHRAALFGKLPATAKDHQNGRIASAEIVCLNASRSLAKCINILTNTTASWAFLRWITPYCLNTVFTLYMGVMKNPFHWMADADIGLMKSVMRCFATSCSHQVAVRPFKKLLQTLDEAMQTARSHKSSSEQNIQSHTIDFDAARTPVDQHTSTMNNQDQPLAEKAIDNLIPDVDFQFQDFFDFRGVGEAANLLQLWPLDLQAGPDEFDEGV